VTRRRQVDSPVKRLTPTQGGTAVTRRRQVDSPVKHRLDHKGGTAVNSDSRVDSPTYFTDPSKGSALSNANPFGIAVPFLYRGMSFISLNCSTNTNEKG